MEIDYTKGKAIKTLVRILCYIAIGIGALKNPLDVLNPYNIGFGVLCGIFFGCFFRMFLKWFLGLSGGKLKKERGREAIRFAVDSGMLFLTPFALMLIIAAFFLNWTMTVPFISAGIMAVGTASAIEIGRMQGKQNIKNTIAAMAVSYAFSFIWTISMPYLTRAPSLIEGGVGLVRSLIESGGL